MKHQRSIYSVAMMIAVLARQWLVTYRSSNTGPGFRRIEVTTEANLHLHYPAGYRVR
jgi:hypothetical protein